MARDTNRGHTVAAVGNCFQLAKDAGFKARSAALIDSIRGLLLGSTETDASTCIFDRVIVDEGWSYALLSRCGR